MSWNPLAAIDQRRGTPHASPQMTEATPSLANEILVEIRRILRSVGDHSRATALRSGLTLPQVLVLRAVADADPTDTTVATIARTVGLSPATVSGIVDRLTRAGLIDRDRDARDRRRVVLVVTPHGRTKLTSLPTPLQEDFVHRLGELSEARRAALLAALRELVALLGAEGIDASPILTPGDIPETRE